MTRFSASAPEYAEFRPLYPRELLDFLWGLADPEALVWEAGCGSGQFTRTLAAGYRAVIASDASAAQVRLAPALPGVHYLVERAEESASATAVAGLAVAAQAAHWFDLPRYYEEVKRVGTPRGHIVLLSYGRVRASGPVGAVVAELHGRLSGFWPKERRHVEAGYGDIPFPFAEVPAPELEITHHWSIRQFIGYVRSWSIASRLEDAGILAQLSQALESAWPGSGAAVRFTWPLAVRAGRLAPTLRYTAGGS